MRGESVDIPFLARLPPSALPLAALRVVAFSLGMVMDVRLLVGVG